MCRPVRLDTPVPEADGELGEAVRRLLSDGLDRARGPERLGIGEDRPQFRQNGRVAQFVIAEHVHLRGSAGELGVDFVSVEIADDQERRVLQILMVEQKLLIGCRQIGVLALVLPSEMLAHPDIGESLPPGALGRALFEAVPGPVRVGFGWSLLAEHPAEIDEMLLCG